MKRIVFAVIATGLSMAVMAQDGSKEKVDTIKVGGITIIRKGDTKGYEKKNRDVTIIKTKPKKNSTVSTNWWIVDLGFANYTDNTNYTTALSQGFVGNGVGKDQMKLRTGKSVNVNIWMFMQKLNMIEHVVNLKYGLGVELNNYRFKDRDLTFQKEPTKIVLPSTPPDPSVHKNKLAADYVTVPVMLNFNFTPHHSNGFGFSAGVSWGYLYSARQKFKYDDGQKTKTHDDFDLEKWKLSYVGELELGPIHLYGSLANKSMWSKGLDQTPYTVGIRLSHF